VVPWFNEQLERLEALDLSDDARRRRAAERVFDMITMIDDHLDEGEPDVAALIENYSRATPRLNALRMRFTRSCDDDIQHV
jgi:hypothetical protein